VDITKESKYKDFLRRFVGDNFSSYYKFHDQYSDFIKPATLSQVLKTKNGKYIYPKEISFSKWVPWVNNLEISKKEKRHLILLRLKDEMLKDLSSSSEETKLIDDIIAQNSGKSSKSNSSKNDGNLSDLMIAIGYLNKNRFKYVKDTIKSCMLEEIATRPSMKAIELKQLFKKIF
jgi:hypothetical protein